MSKVTLQGHIVVPDSDLTAVEAALPAHIALTRQEAGCLIFEVGQDPTDRRRFRVYEEFVDRAAFELHQQRVKNSPWGQITRNVARYYQVSGLA